MRAVTDAGPTKKHQKKPEPIRNLFQLMHVVSKPETMQFFDDEYNNMAIRYGDMKKQLAEDMIAFTAPIREKIIELSANDEYLHKVAKLGREKARASASKTVSDVRDIIGFREF
jgi:tryptophanyl-tRNA synthetase